ncbi:UNVERIFIED_ORG: hypothetical protein J2W66_001943 [Agrobacterium larrymoorei]|nr:hypothetical protein [Agrobacterium larrymoorei]
MVSSTSENSTSFWPVLEQTTLRAFMEVGAADSPGVVDAIDRAVRYVKIDDSRGQIVLDSRAFLLGLLSSGRQDTPSAYYGNTATWIASFVAERFRNLDIVLSQSLTGTDSIMSAAERGYRVVVSSALANDVNRARGIARSTVNRPNADLRHIVSAHLVTDRQALEFFRPVGWRGGRIEVAELRAELYRRLEETHEAEENLKVWWSILRPNEQLPEAPPLRTEPPAIEVSGFASDRPTARTTDDALDLSADVTAFARLICLQDIDPPLSIGLFGEWGSGKSTFMHHLEATVDEVTRSARAKPSDSAKRLRGPAFIRNAVQIRFNAWHFADANLWASLTAEFFDQLRAGGYARSGKAIHARLVERVNNHVHQLTAEAKATRDAVVESEENVRQALSERDEAAAKATLEVGKAISQTLVDSVVTAYETHKADLKELSGKSVQKDIGTFIALAKDLQSIRGQFKTIAEFILARKWRAWLAIAGFAAVSVASYVTFKAGPAEIETVQIVAFLAGASALARSILPGISLISSITRSTSAFAEDLDKKLETQLKAVAEKEDALRKATAESEARRAASERASKALSRYVDPRASGANPPRLLRYMLEDNPDTQALEKEIGLISRVRRLFQAVNEIVAEEKGKKEGERDQDVPDRIIIYIDDLDRCSPPQVYAVLQAIHLLLAFELFVVVVGVDVTWVEEALAHELRPALRGLHISREEIEQAEREARKLATRYMEKIFQLPFWIRRLSTEGPAGGSYASYVRGMLQQNLETDGDLQLEPSEPHSTTGNANEESLRSGAPVSRDTAKQFSESQKSDAETDTNVFSEDHSLGEALATVKLTTAEVEFLSSEAIGRLAGREPRTVKRFINIYRIIRARLDASQRTLFLGSDGQPPVYPIVAILVATEMGQGLETAQNMHKLLENLVDPIPLAVVEERVQPAWAAAQDLRDGAEITGSECRPWSLLVQRYSFNRYD